MDYFSSVLVARDNSEFLWLLALAAAKSTLLLAFVALLCRSLRSFSAATRHLFWTAAICAALLLPCLSFLTIWELPILPAPESVLIESVSDKSAANNLSAATPEARFDESNSVRKDFEIPTNAESLKDNSFVPDVSLPTPSPKNAAFLSAQTVNGILAVWFAGALLLLFRLFIGFSATDSLARRAAEFEDAAYNELFSTLLIELNLKADVRLRRSEQTLMPVVCGVFRPVVLLPASADKWSEERLRLVLLHELTHVARRDCLTQTLAQAACAFYWFNPLVWYAAACLRVERERACDDRVLSVGTKPSDYAHHLLEIARSMQNRSVFDWSKTATVAMARRSQFEGRLLAILSEKSERRRMSRLMTGSIAALIGVLFFSAAVIRPTAIDARKSSFVETASVGEKDRAEASLPNSFLTSEKDSRMIQNYETVAANRKQENADASIEKPEARALTSEPTFENAEPIIKLNSKENAEQNISETVQPQVAAPVQTPELIMPPAPEINPFVNTEYRQKSKTPTQDKPGDFIDEMASVGLTNLSVDELIMLKTHRVTADFVRGLRAFGFNNLTPKTITNLRTYNVTPAYIEAMAAAGYKGLTLKDLANARIYKVTPEYAKAIQDAGYPSLSIGQLINFRIYKITPELVRSARGRLGDLTPKQMISLKISGVLNEVKDKKKDTK